MFTSLVFGAALTAPGAPVPQDTVPAPAAAAPQVAYVKADAGGQVWLQYMTYQKMKQQHTIVTIENGKQVAKQEEVEVTAPVYSRKQLTDLGGKFTTADGTELTAADATRRVKDGAPVLVSSDGKPVEKAWLRAVDPDTVVIAAEALAGATVQGTVMYPPVVPTPAPRLALLGADADGKVRVAFNPNAGMEHGRVYYGRGGLVAVNGVVQPVLVESGYAAPSAAPGSGPHPTKPLEEVKFDAYDLTGVRVPRDEALRRLKAGGLVVIAGDDRPPDEAYLKLFKGDLLVLASSELAGVPNGVGAKALKPVAPALAPAAPAPAVAPAVAVPAVAIPAVKLAPPVVVPAPAKQLAVPANPAKQPVAPAPKPVPREKKD